MRKSHHLEKTQHVFKHRRPDQKASPVKTPKVMSNDTKPEEIATVVPVPERPLFQVIDNPDFLAMSKQLSEILDSDMQQERGEFLDLDYPEFAIGASPVSKQNDLSALPQIWLLLCDLPISKKDLVTHLPLVEMRAAFPDSLELLNAAVRRKDDSAAVELVDTLNSAALMENNKTLADISDFVLFELAVNHQVGALFPRLVRRMRDLKDARGSAAYSVMNVVRQCAEARLRIMMLKRPWDDQVVDIEVLKGDLHDHNQLNFELLQLLEEAGASPFKCIRLWLNVQLKAAIEKYPILAGAWSDAIEEDVDFERAVASFMRTDRRKSWAQTSLKEITRDVDRLHRLLIQKKLPELKDGIDQKDIAVRVQPRPSPIKKGRVIKSSSKNDPETTNQPTVTAKEVSVSETAESENSLSPTLVVVPQGPERESNHRDDPTKEIRGQLEGKALRLMQTPDLRDVRQHLKTMLPHLSEVIDRILNAMAPHSTLKLPPVLLVGQPGSGKTTLLEELVKILAVPSLTFDAAGHADAHLLGTDKRWGNSAPGVHLELFAEHMTANPVIIVGELEKVGGSERSGDMRRKLLGFLEPRRAASVFDTFLSTPIDASALSWVFTANSLHKIPGPLQNRLEIIQCRSPKPEHLNLLAPQLLSKIYTDRGLQTGWCEPLTQYELDTLRRHWRGGSIRNLKRLMQAVVDCREKFMTRA